MCDNDIQLIKFGTDMQIDVHPLMSWPCFGKGANSMVPRFGQLVTV